MPPQWSFSGLFGKDKQDGSKDKQDGSNDVPDHAGDSRDSSYDDPDDAPVSPLAMMSEKSPEAWLGQFLTILGAPPALQFSTITAAKQDTRLTDHLKSVMEVAAKDQPVRLLEPGHAEQLKAQDWAVWWRASEALGRYCYAVLSLVMLGDTSHNSDLVLMYRQNANSRIQKDAHYAICYLLGKDWQSYRITETDLARLTQ